MKSKTKKKSALVKILLKSVVAVAVSIYVVYFLYQFVLITQRF